MANPIITVSGASVVESANGNPVLQFTLTLSEPASATVDVNYRTLQSASTALDEGVDYFQSASFVRISAGQTSTTLSIQIQDLDTLDEADESVVVEFFNPQNAVFPDGVRTLEATGVILDDDGTDNDVGLFVENAQVVEGADGVTRHVAVPVLLSRPLDHDLTLNFSTTAGSAGAGVDYIETAGTITFLAGETKTAAFVPIIGDALAELDETFTLTVARTAEIANGPDGATGTVTVIDGDAPGLVGVSVNVGGSAAVAEGQILTRTITFTDGDDTGAAGWTYEVDWDGDGLADETGAIAAGNTGFDISHTYADGPAAEVVSVMVIDEAGADEDTASFAVTVNNVAPTLELIGADVVDEGAPYTLTLANLFDPGTDTVSSFQIDWGDGSPVDTVSSLGDVTHDYGDDGVFDIAVTVTDEDGSYAFSKTVTVGDAVPTATVAGADTTDEGALYTLSIMGSDSTDAADTLSYAIDWGDGTAVQTLTAVDLAALGGEVGHVFADDEDGPVNATPRTIRVTVSNEDGTGSTAEKEVTVNNVAPLIPLSGAATGVAGQSYTLNLGTITDPGQDVVNEYLIDWGDGSAAQSLTAAGAAARGGEVDHVYASMGDFTIAVDLADEDGSHPDAGSHTLTVAAAPPTVSLEAGADASLTEGDTFTRSIVFSDSEDNGAAGWSYEIDYGDGMVETGTTAVQNLDLAHVYADGPASHTVTVTVTDESSESASDGFALTVHNVAPTIELGGAASIGTGVAYTLTLGAVTDPGADTVSDYLVDWGDGSVETYDAAGEVTHTYTAAGAYSIAVDLVDEDGTFTDAGSKTVTVDPVVEPEIVRIGDAPARLTRANPDAWSQAWSHDDVTITHKVDANDAGDAWSPVNLQSGRPLNLAGSDVYLGDLGVSGRSAATSSVPQEIDGTEGLRFELARDASQATLELSRFYLADDGQVFAEVGRVQAFDENGDLVAEQTFVADSASGRDQVVINAASGFHSLVVTAGAYDGAEFVAGGYANGDGSFATAPVFSGGTLHGSDFLLDAVEFEFAPADLLGTNGVFGSAAPF